MARKLERERESRREKQEVGERSRKEELEGESWKAVGESRGGKFEGEKGYSIRKKSKKQEFSAVTYDSLIGTKMKSFWKRSTCLVHVFTLLCFRFWILRRRRSHTVEQ